MPAAEFSALSARQQEQLNCQEEARRQQRVAYDAAVTRRDAQNRLMGIPPNFRLSEELTVRRNVDAMAAMLEEAQKSTQ